MKNKLLISALLGLVVTACNLLPERKIKSNEMLDISIKEVISKGDSFIDMSDLTDFHWDSLLILGPYTWIDDCKENYGIDCSPIEHTNIQHLDDLCVLLFLFEGEIHQMVECSRHPGDFVRSADYFFTPEESIFKIVETDIINSLGETWIDLIQINVNYP